MICWMTNEPLRPRQKLAIKHTTRTGRALVKDIQYRLDVNTLHRDQETKELGLNEIGRVQLRTTVPLLCDPYSKNRTTGSFILIDEATGVTVGAGMINSLNEARAPTRRGLIKAGAALGAVSLLGVAGCGNDDHPSPPGSRAAQRRNCPRHRASRSTRRATEPWAMGSAMTPGHSRLLSKR